MPKPAPTSPAGFMDRASNLVRRWTGKPPRKSPERREGLRRWFADRGDQTRSLDHPSLTRKSVVMDVGGFEGNWAAAIYCRYACRVEVFEPVPSLVEKIEGRFAGNGDVVVHRFGLSDADQEVSFAEDSDRSSAFASGRDARSIQVQLRDVAGFLASVGHDSIDLLKMNIEGGEFPLLERLLDAGLMPRIKRLQIQFHEFVPDAHARRAALVARMEETHQREWNYDWVWECWSR